MATISRSITIAAPVARIFDYTQEPAKLPEFWPGIEEVGDVERLANGGTRFRLRSRFAGIPIHMVSEDVEVKPNECVVNKTSGGLDATVTWLYAPAGDGTQVTVNCEYTVPIPLLGKMAEALIVKANEKDIETMLANVKAWAEG